MNLPFVPDETIIEFGESKIDFQAIYDDLKKNNPHLLNYIVDLPNYLHDQKRPITRGILVHLGLSICALISNAAEQQP